ncbi:hypothetical protein KCP76_19790 [Salmonella enterica subsp. enterica serovar Weltevreden]|nr:hypothetical protein KCP76_19790 [Salmonella enterica subsp. enterica serovar Weltevreden]
MSQKPVGWMIACNGFSGYSGCVRSRRTLPRSLPLFAFGVGTHVAGIAEHRLCSSKFATGMRHGTGYYQPVRCLSAPNYNATRHRLCAQDYRCTLVGVATGLPILWFVLRLKRQLVLLVITGAFLRIPYVQYAHATMFITLLVLLCF